jgi:ribosomal-protein-alanine N-acetyltransferase
LTETLETPRLHLLPLPQSQLRQYLEDPGALECELGLRVSRTLATEILRRAIGLKLQKMAAAPEPHHAWLTYWLIVIKESSFGAGMAGFKGFPDPSGEAEIGYGIDPAYQNRGYMTESVQALIAWAFREPACRSVVARGVQKTNAASRKVLAKAGMTVYDETEDAFSMQIRRGGNPAG